MSQRKIRKTVITLEKKNHIFHHESIHAYEKKNAVTEMNYNAYCVQWTFEMKYAGKPNPANNNNSYLL